MGQQQLLLLVLGIVIVGIAVVAGIQAFSEGKVKAEQDAAISDAMRIISDTQAWKLKPSAFGGGASSDDADFQGVSMKALGYPSNPYITTNGCYNLGVGSATGVDLTIYADTTSSTACNTGTEIATVKISGTGTDSGSLSWLYATN